MIHKPVLLEEVLYLLAPKPNENFIDATLGEGGHTKAILRKTAPAGIVLGIERDGEQIERAKRELWEFGSRVFFVNDSFGNLENIVSPYQGMEWKGILFDLGWSRAQLESSGRGFSFERDEPLDMRYNNKFKVQSSKFKILTAKDIVNKWPAREIEKILREYGEERFSKVIAQAIIRARKQKSIETTFQLVNIIRKATPIWYHHRKIHPTTKTFQALRIAVNNEFEELRRGLEAAIGSIAKNGKIVLISFHSGEDRIIKYYFNIWKQERRGTTLVKKPIMREKGRLRVFQKV